MVWRLGIVAEAERASWCWSVHAQAVAWWCGWLFWKWHTAWRLIVFVAEAELAGRDYRINP
jgi:hypothetical protein